MRNYDTTTGTPYPRVPKIEIEYSESGVPRVEYMECMAILDSDGIVRHLDGPLTRNVLDLAGISEPVQVVNPTTGEPILGQTATVQQIMLALLAFLRADQKRRDELP
jgi:hypothetical protein